MHIALGKRILIPSASNRSFNALVRSQIAMLLRILGVSSLQLSLPCLLRSGCAFLEVAERPAQVVAQTGGVYNDQRPSSGHLVPIPGAGTFSDGAFG